MPPVTGHSSSLGVLVVRTIAEPAAERPMVVEVVRLDARGHDQVLLVTTSKRRAARVVRNWLEAEGTKGVVRRCTTALKSSIT
jgi:hypothetical protein